MKSKLYRGLAAGMVMMLTVTACGNSSSEPKAASSSSTVNPEDTKEVTLTVAIPPGWEWGDEAGFADLQNAVAVKYPNIKLKLHAENVMNGNPTGLEKLIAAGAVPDLVITSTNKLSLFDQFGLSFDMADLMKKNKMDSSIFEDNAIALVKASSKDSQMIAIPYNRHYDAMYYNKDIFDKFGVPYPTKAMNWTEARELA